MEFERVGPFSQTRKFSKRQIILRNKSQSQPLLHILTILCLICLSGLPKPNEITPLMIFYETDLSVKRSNLQAALLTS